MGIEGEIYWIMDCIEYACGLYNFIVRRYLEYQLNH